MSKPDCAACPFRSDKGGPRHKPVLGAAPFHAKAVLVGEGPGHQEVEEGTPFVGRTGQWLDQRLYAVGLDREDLAVLNATACEPPKGMKTDANMGAATHCCRPLFDEQYQPFKRLPVLAMGKWATQAVTGGRAIAVETGRGFVRDIGPGLGNLIVTWHPTYAAFHNPWKAGEFVTDLERFKRLIDGTLEAAPKTIIHPKVGDVARVMALAHKQGAVAVDIETRAGHERPAYEGKDPTRAELRTIALGTPDLGVAYWWGSDQSVQRVICAHLHDKTIVKVFHNGYFFDLRVLERYGIRPEPVMDTRDMRRAVSATSRLSLRFLASIYSDFAPWKEDEK